MAGFPVLTIDRHKLYGYVDAAIDAGLGYGFGGKDPKPGTFPPEYSAIDCSGFALTTLAYATGGATLGHMPDGSDDQADWCIAAGFKRHRILAPSDYGDAVASLDNHVRICFHRPCGRNGDSTGHVWFALRSHDGSGSVIMSYESYGGHGPGSRPILHQWFMDHCDEVFVLA